jgi:hypothetical protein
MKRLFDGLQIILKTAQAGVPFWKKAVQESQLNTPCNDEIFEWAAYYDFSPLCLPELQMVFTRDSKGFGTTVLIERLWRDCRDIAKDNPHVPMAPGDIWQVGPQSKLLSEDNDY